MATTRLEFVEDGSRKFWEVAIKGSSFTVRFGRLGTEGQSKTKKCSTPAAAEAEAAKLTAEKLKKGYARTGGVGVAVSKAKVGVKPVKVVKSVKTVKSAAPSSATVAAFCKQLQVLVPACFEADRELTRSLSEEGGGGGDEESIASALGKPCSKAELDALEKHLGCPLPGSYRAYLTLYGSGKKSFGSPIGPAEHRSKDVRDALNNKSGLYDEFNDENPITAGAIPFIVDGDSREMVLLVPPAKNNGEMAVVDYDITEEQQRYPDLVSYFRANLAVAQRCVEKERKAKLRRGILTPRQAIDALLASHAQKKAMSKTALRAAVLRLSGQLPDGSIPTEATITSLKDRAESERFVAALRGVKGVPAALLLSLSGAAVELLTNKDERAKALPVIELFFDLAPKKPSRTVAKSHGAWLEDINSAIHRAFGAKELVLSARLSELARPHARANQYIPHNAACAFVAAKRYDDALEMCRLAVEINYAHLDKLKTDKDLGPLLGRREFKALFA